MAAMTMMSNLPIYLHRTIGDETYSYTMTVILKAA